MAELIGAVASGITLAQVAGGIIQTSFKIKRLMSECDEIPARLETLLNQIEILAPIVSEASTNNGALPLQASLNGALHNATTHCQMALDQLNSIAETLSSQIEVSRGIKRKFKLVKALLKGDQIIQCTVEIYRSSSEWDIKSSLEGKGQAALLQAGFDLQQYGIREKQQLQSEDPQDFYVFEGYADDNFQRYKEIRLIAFTYGSEVEDWKLWWSEPTDEFVGDFWRQIDPEPLHIPGSWIDDDVW
ncbi:hypothetical protein GQX73_g6095 [Xylaria multiplex]|uniref:Fungal N-terminal domain-containing protein n=1 Tax=Xylaria multiplex TaxID=323545 RepID=A0A7C8IQX3_9PEZI|nr:hypothetical protein GQX73_g6095 [Xylaria multiplex]